jgi:hypothetical protein
MKALLIPEARLMFVSIAADGAPTDRIDCPRHRNALHGSRMSRAMFGSVDIFLEALEKARVANVLMVDNDGRLDGACVGDLVTREVQKASLQGIVRPEGSDYEGYRGAGIIRPPGY